MKRILALLACASFVVPAQAGRSDFLMPYRENIYTSVLAWEIENSGPAPADILVALNALPNAGLPWGVRVFRDHDKFVLRVVRFTHGIWYAAYEPDGSSGFRRKEGALRPPREVRDIEITPALAREVARSVEEEIRNASPEGMECGLDGDFYVFAVGQGYAEMSCYDVGSRRELLMNVFEELVAQSSGFRRWFPTRGEQRVTNALRKLRDQ